MANFNQDANQMLTLVMLLGCRHYLVLGFRCSADQNILPPVLRNLKNSGHSLNSPLPNCCRLHKCLFPQKPIKKILFLTLYKIRSQVTDSTCNRQKMIPDQGKFSPEEHSRWIWEIVPHQPHSIPEGYCPAAAFQQLPSLCPRQAKRIPRISHMPSLYYTPMKQS